MKVLAGIVGGFVLAVLAALLVSITFAASKGTASTAATVVFFIVWAGGLAVSLQAPDPGKAWRRLLLTSSVASLLLPLSGLIYTGVFMASRTNSGAQAAGAAIGGGLVSGFLGFLGFFLGVVFLIIGLLVGREAKVIYVERSPAYSKMLGENQN